jgi:signal transduction histidine kinase
MTRPCSLFPDPSEERRNDRPPIPPGEGRRFSRRRPPFWWPQNGCWPPAPLFRPWRRHPFRFRFGCLFLLFFLLSGGGCLVAWMISYFHFIFPENFPRGVFLVPLLGFVLFALLVGAILGRIVNPLDEVMEAADRVASGDYSARLKERGPAQVRAFTRSFNTMTARLQAYDEQRKRMLADISHELRTPLTVLQGNLEGMLDSVYPRDEEHISLLLEETRILSRLIDDLRTFSLAETGRLILQKEPCDPARLVADLVQAMQSAAAEAGVMLAGQTAADLPAVEMDAARIREVLENLVANAVRHTAAGGWIRVGCRRDPDRGSRLEFRVEDNGAGIPKDLLPHVFDRYVKSVDSGGTGLGLAIAKRLVEEHGGEIRAESETGKGTTVRFWIPG